MSSDDGIPRSGRLEEKAVRGVFSTVLMFASNKVITFGTTLVLARILTPSDFGIVALASVTIGLLALFSDLGLGGTLVVRKHLDDRISGTIFTLMLLMGVLTALLVAGTAPLAASIFDEPDLTPILAVLGATVILNAPTWFYSTILQRELEFWRRFQCQLAQSVTYAAVAIGAAIAGAGVWALVAGQVAGTLVFTVTLAAASPYRIRPSFDRDSAGTAIREGRGFLAQSGLAYVELNADYMSVGGFLGSAQLGYYSMAFRIAELPYWAITEPVAKVTFPGFARMRHRGESVTASFLSVLRLVALVACPTGILLSATAEPFTITVYGSEWLPMAGVLAILGVWGTLNHIEASIGWLMNSVEPGGAERRNLGGDPARVPRRRHPRRGVRRHRDRRLGAARPRRRLTADPDVGRRALARGPGGSAVAGGPPGPARLRRRLGRSPGRLRHASLGGAADPGGRAARRRRRLPRGHLGDRAGRGPAVDRTAPADAAAARRGK